MTCFTYIHGILRPMNLIENFITMNYFETFIVATYTIDKMWWSCSFNNNFPSNPQIGRHVKRKETEKIEFWWLNTNKSWYGFVETRSNNTNHKRWINQCWRWFCVIDCCNLSATDVFAWLLLFPNFSFVPFSKSFRANVERKKPNKFGPNFDDVEAHVANLWVKVFN